MPSIYLPNRSFITISGNSAQSFLQNIIPAKINALPFGIARGTALLSPQGKILFYFLISKLEEDVFVLEIDSDQSDLLMKKLFLYRLRANVTFEAQKISGVTLSWNQDNFSENPSFIDERFSIAGVSLQRTQGCSIDSTIDPKEYYNLRIDHGIVDPDIDYPSSSVLPYDLLMDMNKGISFTKGCYIGQEIISRMKHRNMIRKRSIMIIGNSFLPPKGSPILAANKTIGILGIVVEHRALAIARIDKINESIEENVPLTANNIKIVPSFPFWSGLKFSVVQNPQKA
ncbi:folate-binding protein YgfZ [Candidatus Liberibacter sp.]|uniref:CAF17-like 4Fe-4S cluster assembly/insertion protein YgfZ n=1 Tax=Candidatus Liberibacter sp. TaxID=34022 RepID=UPI0015F3B846|nr:folate-binding protein YgfZ [Candidatus Liberibacter sp.]MBA5724519.1 folate-binding protein YgfZ [Candidatus Liberibacter sp.]